ncbi:uracil-DNA glycosylase [Candidatus Poriferisocius sp.]|uniref:uracil-DNA glycosylase n=1 Tax=Candidatus Poriferisocius sp. TaxID=3101276 RepID=UPI003B015927
MSLILADVAAEAANCTKCELAQKRTQVVFGMGNPDADLMFVGEGPGAEEDKQGLPFVGRSGKLLDRLMAEEMGLTRDLCYIANVVKCRPPDNRDPKPEEVDTCRSWLERQIQLITPRVIVTLGNFSSKLLLDTTTGITKLRGRSYPFDSTQSDQREQNYPLSSTGTVIIPTFHPAAVLRGGGLPEAQMRSDLVRARMAISG